MAETADFLLGQLDSLGMEAQLLPSAGWPFVFGQRLDAPGKPTVLLYGHYDVQPPEPLDEWLSSPFLTEKWKLPINATCGATYWRFRCFILR